MDNTLIQNEERIECTFLISITERISNDEFKTSVKVLDLYMYFTNQLCLTIMIKILDLNILNIAFRVF